MSWKGTYDGTIHYNPVDKFTIIIVKTSDQNVPREARQERRYPDHLIRFTAIGYEIPCTDAVELEMDGEWVDGKHGFQLQVEHWKEIIPRSEEGVKGYLSSGLIKGIGPKLADVLQDLVLCGTVVLVKAKMCKQERDLKTGRLIQKIVMEDLIYRPNVFEQEDETARQIALRLTERQPQEQISSLLEKLKVQFNLMLSEKQEMGVKQAFQSSLSIITGPPGTGKTTVIKMIIELFRVLYPKSGIMLMAPTGRASRRMAESTGFEEARTMHNALRLSSEEAESYHSKEEDLLSAGLIIIDEFSLVDMWLAKQFFTRLEKGTKIVLVGDVDQLPSVGAGNVLREMIQCGLVPVTVLDEIFRQAKDSFIPYNGKLINQGDTNLFYGNDFVFIPSAGQTETSEKLVEMYCQEIAQNGVERVQILSPFRAEGETSVNRLNAVIREIVNPFCSTEDEINVGIKTFRIGDRIMQTKNIEHVSNGDLGFIRSIEDTPNGKKVSVEFGEGRKFEYGLEELNQLELAYATTVHKAMGSEARYYTYADIRVT